MVNNYEFYYSIKKEVAKIDYLGVQKRHQNKGIRREVVNNFLKKCRMLGVEKVLIDVYWEAIGFWEKFGFVIDPEPQIIGGHVQDYHDGYLLLEV